jgi:hypothetical protein
MSKIFFILLIFIINSCSFGSNRKVLEVVKDENGRVIKKVSEGFESGEGTYWRTVFYDTLGREIKIMQIKDLSKTVTIYLYSDSSTYEEQYYDLGETKDYSDTNFKITDKELYFTSHIRINSKGNILYQFKKWFETDSTTCKEFLYDSTGNLIDDRDIECK